MIKITSLTCMVIARTGKLVGTSKSYEMISCRCGESVIVFERDMKNPSNLRVEETFTVLPPVHCKLDKCEPIKPIKQESLILFKEGDIYKVLREEGKYLTIDI